MLPGVATWKAGSLGTGILALTVICDARTIDCDGRVESIGFAAHPATWGPIIRPRSPHFDLTFEFRSLSSVRWMQ
jgi:hypothetical protein